METFFYRSGRRWVTENFELEARAYWKQNSLAFFLEVPQQECQVEDVDPDGNPVVATVDFEHEVYKVVAMHPMPIEWVCEPAENNKLPPGCIELPVGE